MSSRTAPTAAPVRALSDPLRSQLYDFVARSRAAVGRDDAARAVGISRTLAAYHLDQLADAGLLAIAYARPEGRGGPGAGRPAKLYTRAHDEISVNIPPRNYHLLARMLAAAVATDSSGAVAAALTQAAREEGAQVGASGSGLWTSLEEVGYEPREEDGLITLVNCPFHQVAQHQTELVCSMNYALVQGLLTGCGQDCRRAELAPGENRCCVLVHPEPRDS